jgi:hypothetical protein
MGRPTPRRERSLYELLLGHEYGRVHPRVRRAHEPPLRGTGEIDVVHGDHPLAPFLVRLMKLPAAGRAKAVSLRVDASCSPDASTPTLTWMRQIGECRLETRQFMRHGLLVETAGLSRVAFALRVSDGGIDYEQREACVAGIRLPAAFAPRVRARVDIDPDGWSVDVTVDWRGSLICRYWGRMRPECENS